MADANEFERQVANNGVKLKNVPNTEATDDTFRFSDYVAKDVGSWAYVPDVSTDEEAEQIAKETADEMYKIYRQLDQFDCVTITEDEDEMYWVSIEVDVPDDRTTRNQVADAVAEAILSRQQ